jgi:predicted AAA+ superfamily ATPase
MPHHRSRLLSPWAKKLIKGAPALGLIGMRQTGKTTLLEELASIVYRFDQETNVIRFSA